jgi:hypothetical protein
LIDKDLLPSTLVRGSSAIGHNEVLQYAPRCWYDALFLVRGPACSIANIQPTEKRKDKSF